MKRPVTCPSALDRYKKPGKAVGPSAAGFRWNSSKGRGTEITNPSSAWKPEKNSRLWKWLARPSAAAQPAFPKQSKGAGAVPDITGNTSKPKIPCPVSVVGPAQSGAKTFPVLIRYTSYFLQTKYKGPAIERGQGNKGIEK